MKFELPSFSTKGPITTKKCQQITDSLEYQHDHVPFVFNESGIMCWSTYGMGCLCGYLYVDPATYPGYQGHPGVEGKFEIPLPAFFAELLSVHVTPAAGPSPILNAALAICVSSEDVDSITVRVWNSGGLEIGGFAAWIEITGFLIPGKIP